MRHITSIVTPSSCVGGAVRKDGLTAAVLSDVSQSQGSDIAFLEAQELHLDRSRSSMRMFRAQWRQLDGKRDIRCHHKSTGPPMRSQLFDVTGDKHECYAKEVRKALELILDDFRDLRLHNRLAILVPNGEFLQALEAPLQKELKSISARSFELVSAATASAALIANSKREVAVEWLIIDEVGEFDGLERLIVICVGLELRLKDASQEVLETRSPCTAP